MVLGPNKIMNMKNFKFCFYFYLQYSLSHTIPLHVFDLSFLKTIPEVLLMGFYSVKYTCVILLNLPVVISKQDSCPFSILRLFSIFPSLNSISSCNLRHIHYQCLLLCKLSLNYGKQ